MLDQAMRKKRFRCQGGRCLYKVIGGGVEVLNDHHAARARNFSKAGRRSGSAISPDFQVIEAAQRGGSRCLAHARDGIPHSSYIATGGGDESRRGCPRMKALDMDALLGATGAASKNRSSEWI